MYFIENLQHIENYGTIPVKTDSAVRNFCERDSSSDLIMDVDYEVSDIFITFDIDDSKVNPLYVNLLSSILGEGDGSKFSFQ